MSYNPYIRHVYNPARNFGSNQETSANQILADMPQNSPNENQQDVEKYFPLLYKTLFGKDLEEKLAQKRSQLKYLEMSIQKFPQTSGALQPLVNKLEEEISALKWKSIYYASVRVAIFFGGISLAGATFFALVKLPSAISKIGSGDKSE